MYLENFHSSERNNADTDDRRVTETYISADEVPQGAEIHPHSVPGSFCSQAVVSKGSGTNFLVLLSCP